MSDEFEEVAKPYIRVPQPVPYKEKYTPIDTSKVTKEALYIGSIVGLVSAATLNATRKEQVGPLGVITKSGKIWGLFILGSGTYKFSSSALANLREKRDTKNEFYAGSITGAVLGSFTKKLVPTVGISLGVGVIAGFIFWSGSLLGDSKTSAYSHRGIGIENNFVPKKSNVVENQGFWDVARRRPLSQTVEELGEGVFKP